MQDEGSVYLTAGRSAVPPDPAEGMNSDAVHASAADPPLTWCREVDRGKIRWMCEACARANVRGIEGRLDQEWW